MGCFVSHPEPKCLLCAEKALTYRGKMLRAGLCENHGYAHKGGVVVEQQSGNSTFYTLCSSCQKRTVRFWYSPNTRVETFRVLCDTCAANPLISKIHIRNGREIECLPYSA